MDIIVLGSGTGTPSRVRNCPALIVREDGFLGLFDSGSGTLKRVAEAGINLKNVTHLFYTHIHPDHTTDLPAILFALRRGKIRRKDGVLDIWGPAGFEKFLDCLKNAWGEWILPLEFRIRTTELPLEPRAQSICDGRVIISTRAVCHMIPSIGYRIEISGRTAVITGDTDYCDDVVKLAQDCDILICECSMPDDKYVKGHMTPSRAAKTARDAGAKSLLLTHFYPECDEIDVAGVCRKYYDGPIFLAQDLMQLRV